MKLKDKGLTVKDLMSLQWEDINKMGLKELRQATRALGDVIHKREQTLKKHPETSGWQRASEQLARSGGEISTKGKSYNELKKEYSRARDYLMSKTSSYKGARQVQRAAESYWDKVTGGAYGKMTEEQRSRFHSIRERLSLGSQITESESQQLIKMTRSKAKYASDDNLVRIFSKGERKIYEDIQLKLDLATAKTTSSFFGERENNDWTDSDVEDFPF